MNKKDFNNIEIPKNIDTFIEDSFNNAYKLKNRKRVKNTLGIIASGLACFIILGITKPAIASAIPPLQKIFEQLQDRLINDGKDVNYVTEVNKSIKNNGVEVTLTDIIFDGRYLYVSYLVKSDKAFNSEGIGISKTQLLYEHNEEVSFTDEKLDDSGVAGIEGGFIDDNTFEGIEKYDLSSLKAPIPNNFEFEVLINLFRCIPDVGDDRAELMRIGDWGFKVNVNMEEDLSKKIEINSTNNEGIGIKDVVITPFEVIITSMHEEDTESILYNVSITDEYGNSLDSKERTWSETSSEIIFNKNKLKGDKLLLNIYKNSSEDELIFTKEINIK